MSWSATATNPLAAKHAARLPRAGYNQCILAPNHSPLNSIDYSSGADPYINSDYVLDITETSSGQPAGLSYAPGATYTVTVNKQGGAADYRGLLAYAFQGTVARASSRSPPRRRYALSFPSCAGTSMTTRLGTWSSTGLAAQGLRKQTGCNGVVHSSAATKATSSMQWTAPAAGHGQVRLWAALVRVKSTYYVAQKSLMEQAAPSPSGSPQGTPSPTPSPSASVSVGATPAGTPGATPSAATTPSMSPSPTPAACFPPCAVPNGQCVVVGGSATCKCNVGFGGPTCSTCAAAFTPPSQGAATCDLVPTGVALVPLVFVGSIAERVGAPGSAERAAWEDLLRDDVRTALGLPSTSTRVHVMDVGGSVAAGFNATIVLTGSRDSTLTTDTSTFQSTVDLAEALAALAAVPGSALYSGSVTSALEPTANARAPDNIVYSAQDPTVTQPNGCASGQADHAFQVAAGGGVVILWSVVDADGTCIRSTGEVTQGALLLVEARVPVENAWASVAFSSTFNMVGADAVAGYPGSARVVDLVLSARSMSGVREDAVQDIGASASIVTGAAEGAAGQTVLRFAHPLSAADAEDADLLPSVRAGSSIIIMWAHGQSGETGLTNHGPNRRGGGSVNLLTGSFSASSKDPLYLVHGVLMTVAWGLLVPLGVFFALALNPEKRRRGCCSNHDAKFKDPSRPAAALPKGLWYTYHWWAQVFAAGVSAVAFVLALFLSGAAFATTHSIIGVIVYAVSLVQVGWALFKPAKAKAKSAVPGAVAVDVVAEPDVNAGNALLRNVWEMAHRYCAIVLMVMAWASLVLGYVAFGLQGVLPVVIPVGTLALALVLGTAVQWCLVSSQHSKASSSGQKTPMKIPAQTHTSTLRGRVVQAGGGSGALATKDERRRGSEVVRFNPLQRH